MRQMSDNDILFDASRRQDVFAMMKARGYQAKSLEVGSHDVYQKPPVYNFEMHTRLFGEEHDPALHAYYRDAERLLLPDGVSQFGRRLSDDEFYIYMTAHAFKHFSGGGTGLRALTDTYVYLAKRGDALDFAHVERALELLGAAEFERGCRALAQKLLAQPEAVFEAELTRGEAELLSFLWSSGTYGRMETSVTRKLEKLTDGGQITRGAKVKYVLRRVFPDRKFYDQFSPFCRKHPWGIPFYWAFRLVRGVALRGGRIAGELRAVRGAGGPKKDHPHQSVHEEDLR